MADDKKDSGGSDYFGEVLLFLFVLYFISFTIERFWVFWVGAKDTAVVTWSEKLAVLTSGTIWPLWKGFAAILLILAVGSIWYAYTKLTKINKEENKKFGSKANYQPDGSEKVFKNEKWEKVIENINSSSSSDWKVAILESDVMLDELLRRSGYHGDSIGEMLKSVEKSDFLTLDKAWEAHKIRNDIAHRGSDYPLTEREAKHAVALFEDVFNEFKII